MKKEKEEATRVDGPTVPRRQRATAAENQTKRATVFPRPKDIAILNRTLRERTKYLKGLTASIDQFLAWLDREMVKPSSNERGRRIARACNALDMANQHAKLFGLPRKTRKRGAAGRQPVAVPQAEDAEARA